MEQVIQVTGLCVVGALLALVVKRGSPETALLLAVGAAVVVALALAGVVKELLAFLGELGSASGVSADLFVPLYKTIGIALVVQVGGNLCRDAGESALASVVETAGTLCALLAALPLLPGSSPLRVTGNVESAAYIAMTEQALRMAGIRFEKVGWEYSISGGQMYDLPEHVEVEGDWSNAAFFLCMGARSPAGVCVAGLYRDSAQGDRAVLDILREMGAEVTAEEETVTVRRGALRGVTIDARPIPDLIPVLSVLAALAEGETVIEHAGRLRLKESDRLASTAAMLSALGGQVTELPEGLCIQGMPQLAGGTVDACNDHRIAMAAAVAAGGCLGNVVVRGSECVNKSYPDFWRDLDGLKGAEA